MFMVEADVFNLDFRNIKKIEHNNLTIYPIENYSEIQDEVKKQYGPEKDILTGKVELKIPETIEERNSIKYSEDLLHIYYTLLSFAQNRLIYFNNYTLYKIEKEEKKWISSTRKQGRSGKKYSVPNVYSFGMELFILRSYDRFTDKTVNNQTSLQRLMAFWIEAVLYTSHVVEVNISLLWSALEVASKTYFASNPRVFMFSEEKWREIKREIRSLCDRLNIRDHQKSRICGSIGFIKNGSAREQIQYLLENLELPRYDEDLENIGKLRNDIVHGRTINERYGKDSPADLSMKCQRLLEKIILKNLNVYEENYIHSAFNKENLRASI